MRRSELVRRISATRSELGRLRRMLPNHGPGQSQPDALAAWHLERAIKACKLAEEAYDPPAPPEEATDG